MAITLPHAPRVKATQIMKIADGGNRWTVSYSEIGTYQIHVENVGTGVRSRISTRSSIATILLLKENISSPAFGQAAWTLLRFAASLLDQMHVKASRKSA